MNIQSTAFKNNELIPPKYTCDGENINPQLSFSNIPEEAKSIVLIMDDPDAPNGTWIHWTIWNIKPDKKEIKENSVPDFSVQGKTSSDNNKYDGPCPPSGIHRYFFRLYALDDILNLDSDTDSEKLKSEIKNHIIEETELMGKYGK